MKRSLSFGLIGMGAAALLLWVPAAQAGFVLEKAAADAQADAKDPRRRVDLDGYVTARVTQRGTAPVELPVVRGVGKGVSLIDALKQLMPPGWKAFEEGGVDMADKVSWSGSRNWVMHLHDIASERNLDVLIDWDRRETTLSPSKVKPKAEAVAVADKAGAPASKDLPAASAAPAMTPGGTAAASAASVAAMPPTVPSTVQAAAAPLPTPSAAAAPSAPASANGTTVAATAAMAGMQPSVAETSPPPPRKWVLSADHTLRENLRRWSKDAGWTLVWSARIGERVIDYPIDAPVTIEGEFEGREGAVARVVGAFIRGDHPLEVEFFRANKVVEVRMRNNAIARQ